MNTFTLYQAIANNPGKTLRELAVIAEMPYNVARRALQTILSQGLVQVAKAVKNGPVTCYTYRLAN